MGPDLHALLYQALAADYGLVITSPDLDPLVQKLYKVRRTVPAFMSLHFVRAPNNPIELWILKDHALIPADPELD